MSLYSIFKYADKVLHHLRDVPATHLILQGYGIRILPSYISSLATRKLTPSNNPKHRFRKQILTLDLVSIAAEEREAMNEVSQSEYPILQSLMPRGYRASRILNGFRIFICHVVLWEMGQRRAIK